MKARRGGVWSLVVAIVVVAVTACGAAACTHGGGPHEVTIAAATSLRNVVPELAHAYEVSHPGAHIAATYGASGDLQKQVEGGAPIDAVMLAAARPVNELANAGRVARLPRVVASNTLVLVARPGGPRLTFATLAELPPGERIAVGEPGAVPAGEYARAWLTTLGTWGALQGRLVLGGDVAAVLAYARRGEVAAAIVYRTEARGIADIEVLDEATGPGAPRPEVVAATVTGARSASEASAFLSFLSSPEGQKILGNFGFGPP